MKKVPILDADIYSKEALAPNTNATKEVIKRYGSEITISVNDVQEINRLALGEIIFSNQTERHWLEDLLHPIIKEKFKNNINKRKEYPIIAMIIPLLYEANFTYLCNERWLIYCTLDQQYERLMHRNKLTYDQAKARIESQLPLEEKKTLDNQIIDNSHEIELCFLQIDKLLQNQA